MEESDYEGGSDEEKEDNDSDNDIDGEEKEEAEGEMHGSRGSSLPWKSLVLGVTSTDPCSVKDLETLSAQNLSSSWLVTGTAYKPFLTASTKCTLVVCADLDSLKEGDAVTTKVFQ